jgi:phenylalanyl-tRNA synthetase alpha chain
MAMDWESLQRQAEADVAAAATPQALEEARVRWLGRSGRIALALREVGRLPAEERPGAGVRGNEVRAAVEALVAGRRAALREEALQARLAAETIDVTLPGRRPRVGHVHPLHQVWRDLVRIFAELGFAVADGPEVESDWYNFGALNIPAGHPTRDAQDSFYLSESLLLRTQTSPVQIRAMQALAPALPVRVVAPGRVYRRDTTDATHSAVFHQIEGLLVDRGIAMSHMKGVIAEFARRLYGPRTRIRIRPSYFPFTEPSGEVDVTCAFCEGRGCRICKGTGWIEILGCGMVHPQVLRNGGYDPEEVSGFAFGMGIDRVAQLRYGIDDLRHFLQNDLRFLEQF